MVLGLVDLEAVDSDCAKMSNKPHVTHQIRVGYEYLALVAEAIKRQTMRECRMQSLSGLIGSSLESLLENSTWLDGLDIEQALDWPISGGFVFHISLNATAGEQCNILRGRIRTLLGRAVTTPEIFAICMQWSMTLPISERGTRALSYWN